MAEPLAEFEVNTQVTMTCYKEGCETASVTVQLGIQFTVDPSFVQSGGVGRMRWNDRAVVKVLT